MLLEFEKKVADFIKAHGLFGSGDKVLLAVSGGADSAALLYALCAIEAEHTFNNRFLCAHLNHQLRGADSDEDETFVIAQADKLNLPIETARLDVNDFARKNKLSIETAARKLRMEALLGIARANSCRCVATAHQKEDVAETVIQRLARGTGFRGLAGIWPMRTFGGGISFVRPLLCVRRGEIVGYLNEHNLKWRTDLTNDDCSYRRNFIRHRLLPELQKQCAGSVVEQLAELAQSAQRLYGLICNSVDKIWPQMADCAVDKVTLDLKSFSAQPPAVKIEVVRRSLTCLGGGERNLTRQHYEEVLQLSQQKTGGRKVTLPDGFMVRREYGTLIFTRRRGDAAIKKRADGAVELGIPGRTQFGSVLAEATVLEADKKRFEKFKQDKTNFIEWFDLDKVSLPLTIRHRQGGERFWPLGLAGEKKAGKFLTAAKVPQEVRERVIIIADSRQIIWLWPVRISEQVKVTDQTRRILQLRIT
jgi:tRNA(Ile)-lysidine synthase